MLLLADTHLGFDDPLRPRVARRRRGPDFWANFERALRPALAGRVDLLVHGGDLLYRSKVPASLVARALAPLKRVADSGVPVALVPGNHERSSIPYPLLARHPNLLIFDRPRSFRLELAGLRVTLAGFPCERLVRTSFRDLLARTGWSAGQADVRLLCLHQAFEGARVGPSDFTFTTAQDVIRARDLPGGLAALLCGHIHRHQILSRDLRGRRLACPVLYPGSTERTAFAEKSEAKGTLLLAFSKGPRPGGRLTSWEFAPLPARPMFERALTVHGIDRAGLRWLLEDLLAEVERDAILRVRLIGQPLPGALPLLRAAALRELAPPDMDLSLRLDRAWRDNPG